MTLPVLNQQWPDPDELAVVEPAPVTLRVMGDAQDPDDPEWWTRRLLQELEDRTARIDLWERYYAGAHPLNFFDDSTRNAFGRRWQDFCNNFVALVIDRLSERFEVTGFRFRDSQGDKDLWDVWQENDLDGWSSIAHTEALIKGVAYVLVEPRAGDRPRITIEDARNAIVALDPRDHRRRLAGLKRWIDERGRLCLYLYLPDRILTYRTPAKLDDSAYRRWLGDDADRPTTSTLEPWEIDGRWPIDNPLGVVPIIPLPNRPRIRGRGRSEVEPLLSNQDRINFYTVMSIVGTRFLSYPQRYLVNYNPEIDPATGLVKNPFKGGPDQIWTFEPPDPSIGAVAKVEPGQFDAADITPILRFLEADIRSMASISGMPYELLLGSQSLLPESGEAKKTGEAALVHKVTKQQTFFGEGWEEVMRAVLLAQNDDRSKLRSAETRWRNPETRNEAIRTDSVVKQRGGGIIDDELALEQLGYSVEQIRRLGERRETTAMQALTPGARKMVEELRGTLAPDAFARVVAALGPAAAPAAPLIPAPTGPRMSPAGGTNG